MGPERGLSPIPFFLSISHKKKNIPFPPLVLLHSCIYPSIVHSWLIVEGFCSVNRLSDPAKIFKFIRCDLHIWAPYSSPLRSLLLIFEAPKLLDSSSNFRKQLSSATLSVRQLARCNSYSVTKKFPNSNHGFRHGFEFDQVAHWQQPSSAC